MAHMFGGFADFSGFSKEDMREMSKDRKIEVMVDWFGHHFEDPVHRTSYNSREGGYLWDHGGPHDANDEIQMEFADAVDIDTMLEAVEKIQEDGIYDWASVTHPDDWPDDDEFAAPNIDKDGGLAPLAADPALPEPVARAEVLRRLDRLEALIIPLLTEPPVQPAMMGHNHPPKDLELQQVISRGELRQVITAIDEIREQAKTNSPSAEIIDNRRIKIASASDKLTHWLEERATKAVDTAIAYGIKAGAFIGVAKALGLEMANTALAIQSWLTSLSLPL